MKRNHLKLQIAALLLSFLMLFTALPLWADDSAPDMTNTSHALLYCFNTDSVLYEKNINEPIAPGYTAQLMTSLLVIEHYQDLNEKVTLTSDLYQSWYFPSDYYTTNDYGFTKDKTLPVKDLLAAMVLQNATSASTFLAALVGGTVEGFVQKMNSRAAALGMENTAYQNPTGLDADGAKTTPADLMKLATYLYKESRFMSLASKASYTLENNGFTVYTRNYLIGKWYTGDHLYSNADGMKAGSTQASGNTVVATSVENNGYTYLAIILGGKSDYFGNNLAYSLATDLLKWGSTSFGYRRVLSKAKLITTLPVSGGDRTNSVPIFPQNDVSAYLRNSVTEDELTFTTNLQYESLTAPLEKGMTVGEIVITLDGDVVGSCALVTGNDVMKGQGTVLRESAVGFFKNPLVIAALILIALLILRKILIYLRRRKKALRKNQTT